MGVTRKKEEGGSAPQRRRPVPLATPWGTLPQQEADPVDQRTSAENDRGANNPEATSPVSPCETARLRSIEFRQDGGREPDQDQSEPDPATDARRWKDSPRVPAATGAKTDGGAQAGGDQYPHEQSGGTGDGEQVHVAVVSDLGPESGRGGSIGNGGGGSRKSTPTKKRPRRRGGRGNPHLGLKHGESAEEKRKRTATPCGSTSKESRSEPRIIGERI